MAIFDLKIIYGMMNSVRVEKGCLKTVAAIGVLFLTGCASGYSLKSVEGGRVAMTDVYDSRPDREAVAVLQPYKHIVDSIMSPVIGHSDMAMAAYRPESPLSNLLADIIRQGAVKVMGKAADVGVMNMGGIRNSLPEGEITFGTVYEITPFENALCVVTLDGAALKKLFSQMASVGGEGLSGARLVITPQGGLVSAEVGGKPVDEHRTYTVATIDYLAEGNDKLDAFREAKSKVFPSVPLLLRTVFMDYVKDCERKGKFVTSGTEGRIRVE